MRRCREFCLPGRLTLRDIVARYPQISLWPELHSGAGLPRPRSRRAVNAPRHRIGCMIICQGQIRRATDFSRRHQGQAPLRGREATRSSLRGRSPATCDGQRIPGCLQVGVTDTGQHPTRRFRRGASCVMGEGSCGRKASLHSMPSAGDGSLVRLSIKARAAVVPVRAVKSRPRPRPWSP